MASSDETPPMTRVRVLSFGAAFAGNVCAMTLAELGADVIKIESPARPDPARTRVFPDHPRTLEPRGCETSALFGGLARSVRGLTLDMRSERGRDLFRRLVPVADVVLENFRPGVLGRWGFDFEALRQLNPGIVLMSMSGFGATGPRRSFTCYAATGAAFSGYTRRAELSNEYHQDYVAAAHAAVAILAALEWRDRTEVGTWIDQAQVETGAALMGPAYLEALLDGEPAEDGSRASSLAQGLFECAEADRWIAIEVASPAERKAAARVLEEDGVTVPAPAEAPERSGELEAALRAWAAGQRPYTAFRRLMRAGVPSGVVQRPGDLYRDPQLRARGAIEEVTHPDLGPIEYPAPVHRLSQTPATIRRPAPRLGEHTAEILAGLLDVSSDELAELRADCVV